MHIVYETRVKISLFNLRMDGSVYEIKLIEYEIKPNYARYQPL